MPYRAFHNRKGERYGRLLILAYIGTYNHSRVWRCQCDCGNICDVSWKQIQQNHRKSCGCRWEETRASYGGVAGHNRKEKGASAFNQLFYNYKRSAKLRHFSFELSKEYFRMLVESPCFYCGENRPTKVATVTGTNGDYFYTGIDRIDNTIGYSISNVRSCCKQCNLAKGSRTEEQFLLWIHRLVTYQTAMANVAKHLPAPPAAAPGWKVRQTHSHSDYSDH
jgi:hypothetical protein